MCLDSILKKYYLKEINIAQEFLGGKIFALCFLKKTSDFNERIVPRNVVIMCAQKC